MNADHTTLYRTHYPVERLTKLVNAAKSGLLSPLDRAGLISDTCALAQAGYHLTSTCLQLIESLDEQHVLPWTDIAQQFRVIKQAWIDDHEVSLGLRQFYRRLAGRVSRRVGWDFNSTDDHDSQQFKALMFFEAGLAGDEEVLQTARKMLGQFMSGDENAVSEVMQRGVFTTVLLHGGEREVRFLLQYCWRALLTKV